MPPQRTSRKILAGRAGHRPARPAALLIALAVVVAVAWISFVRSTPTATAPALAGAQGTYTLASTSATEHGTFSVIVGGDASGHAEGGVSAGAYRERLGPVERRGSAYDAASRREVTVTRQERATTVDTLVGQWPPVWRIATPDPLDYQGLAAVVRSAVEDGDRTVGIRPVENGGRKAWRAAFEIEGTSVEILVDQATGLVTWYADGDVTFTAHMDWGHPASPAPIAELEIPPGSHVKTPYGEDYRYVPSLEEAQRAVSYDVLTSDLFPDGWRLATVGVGADPASLVEDLPGSPHSGGRFDPSFVDPSVVQLHERGLSWATVRQFGPKVTHYWRRTTSQLLDSASSVALSYRQTTLQFGSFEGSTAHTWYGPSGPTLFVSDGRASIVVTGALTRSELIGVAEGLKPVSPSPSASAAPAQ